MILNSDCLTEIFIHLDFDTCLKFKQYIDVQYIYNLKYKNLSMHRASKYGHLEVVKYLHSKNKECTTYAIDRASMNGHLEVVKYLHSKNKDCTTNAMDWASCNGHLEVVKYLQKNVVLGF
jgi:ankyrin repeat protein